MEFKFNEKEEAFRQEVESFLNSTLPPDWAQRNMSWPGGYASIFFRGEDIEETIARYRKKLIEKGWNTISWPKEYGGREYSYVEQAIFDERTSYYRAPIVDVIAVAW